MQIVSNASAKEGRSEGVNGRKNTSINDAKSFDVHRERSERKREKEKKRKREEGEGDGTNFEIGIFSRVNLKHQLERLTK
ncbi:MAG TPA: hypothetical protein DCE78_07495 [Bacteroidetes bacterium]|nr:hypothetical protein [Bacteroidota bacterium]